MTSVELYKLEKQNTSSIHLFLAGMFWHAWEFSAYQFTRYFSPYKIHWKFVKKVGTEMVYLGFPKNGLTKVKEIISEKNFFIKQIDEKHYEINGFIPYNGFESWKKDIVNNTEKSESNTCKLMFLAYKDFYEATKYIYERTSIVSKNLKFGLADKLRENFLEILEHLHGVVCEIETFNTQLFQELFCKIQIKLRLLLDLKQLSIKQWFYISGLLETIKNNLGLESAYLRMSGECLLESGSLPSIEAQNPLENTHYKSPKNAWDGLPQNKSLKFAKPGCGLPIGNLTSQLFGNIYLNDLDHYIKRELKIRSYGRYVDDMVLVHENKDVLLKSIPKIRRFLKEKLNLELHPKKISLQPAYNGSLFLGAYVLPYRMYPSRRIVKNFKESMRGNYLPKKQKELEESYLGLFSHFDAYKLSQKIIFKHEIQGASYETQNKTRNIVNEHCISNAICWLLK